MKTTDIAALISAFMTPIVAVALAYIAMLTARSAKQVMAIDEAVNGKAAGMSTISQDVMTIRDKQERDQPSPNGGNADALLPMVRRQAADLAALLERIESFVPLKKNGK